MQVEVLHTVNLQVIEVIKDTNKSGFASVENVIMLLLQRYQVLSFDQLKVGPVENIPMLRWLININSKVIYCLSYWY